MNAYRVLPTHLQGTADAAIKFLVDEIGVAQSAVRIESEVHPAVGFRPTLQAVTPEKQIVCVEVVDALYPPELHTFILSCRNHSVPVKLFCAFPAGSIAQVDTKSLQFATENGIGILEVSAQSGHTKQLGQPPVALSLGGLRSFQLSSYPAKYRNALRSAINTFRGGSPVKGCAEVYDELEQLSRRIGAKCERIPGALRQTGAIDWQKAPWHTALEFLKTNLDSKIAKCPLLKSPLLSRLIGITEYRNDTGHKPNSVQKMIQRDIALKTRFESAMDELFNLIEASRPLKV